MSHTLPDLATCLPPELLTGDFSYSSSTESESDEDDVTGLTRRFTRSISLQERFKTPYPLQTKRGFAGSPESTFTRKVGGPTQAWSTPTTPFGQRNEDSWELLYAAAEQVAMMKMRMKMNKMNDVVFGNRGLLGAPRPVGAPVSHYFGNRVSGGPFGFRQSAWPPLPVETQRRQQTVGFSNVVKKERAGTGVFLPRNYPSIPQEFNRKPAKVAQSLNKTMDPTMAPPNPTILAGFAPPPPPPPSRRTTGRETREIVLPQEWTY